MKIKKLFLILAVMTLIFACVAVAFPSHAANGFNPTSTITPFPLKPTYTPMHRGYCNWCSWQYQCKMYMPTIMK